MDFPIVDGLILAPGGQGPPGAAGSCQKLPGAVQSRQGPPGAARSHQWPPGAGAARGHLGPPGAARDGQEPPVAARSCREPPESRREPPRAAGSRRGPPAFFCLPRGGTNRRFVHPAACCLFLPATGGERIGFSFTLLPACCLLLAASAACLLFAASLCFSCFRFCSALRGALACVCVLCSLAVAPCGCLCFCSLPKCRGAWLCSGASTMTEPPLLCTGGQAATLTLRPFR